jgi:hypothetical protein
VSCIYCGSADTNDEHHLPRGLGNFKGCMVLTNRVCVRHNQDCGLLDEQLCRSGGESFFRQYLGVTGRKSHTKADPFYRGSAGGGRLVLRGSNQQTGQTTQLELGQEGTVRELRCCCLTADDDSIHVIPITNGMTPAQFRQRFDALKIKHFKEANIFADKEEIPWVNTLLATLNFEKRTEWSLRDPGPITYGPLDIQFTVNNRYFRDIAKIGFHYFLTKMTRFRGDEPCFAEIRRFITSECSIDECTRFVSYSNKQIAYQLQQGARLAACGHILCAEADYLNLTAKVQLFVGPEFLAPVYTVRLGKSPSLIHYSEAVAEFFAYHPQNQRGEYDGEVSDLFRIRGPAA